MGKFASLKMNSEFTYRSGWELAYFQFLETNSDVVKFFSESLRIPYVSNVRTGKLRIYIPDLLVEWSDGRKELIEIKPSRRLTNPKNIKKFSAAQIWCKANSVTFVVLTEKELKKLGLL